MIIRYYVKHCHIRIRQSLRSIKNINMGDNNIFCNAFIVLYN